MKIRTLAAAIGAAIAATAVASPAFAQGAPVDFRLAPGARNPAMCSNLDASMSRVHTFTPQGATAHLKSAGGVNDTMKQTSPQVYETTFQLQNVRLKIVADVSKTPRTLTVTEADYGCRWNATAP